MKKYIGNDWKSRIKSQTFFLFVQYMKSLSNYVICYVCYHFYNFFYYNILSIYRIFILNIYLCNILQTVINNCQINFIDILVLIAENIIIFSFNTWSIITLCNFILSDFYCIFKIVRNLIFFFNYNFHLHLSILIYIYTYIKLYKIDKIKINLRYDRVN